MPELQAKIGGLTLRSPVLAAAGTFGYGTEFEQAVRLDRLGAIITKTVTRLPRDGNPPPRLIETPSGMINAVGLQNVGLNAFIDKKLPQLSRLPVPIIASVLGESPEDLAEMVGRLDAADSVSGIEVNLSCPNVKHGRASTLHPNMMAQDTQATLDMVRAARLATKKTLIAKLSPEVTDLAPIASAAESAGADALTLANTYLGMSLDPKTRRSRLGAATGGVSGPAIRPLAVYRVWYTAQIVKIPIVGLGGILKTEDALEFFMAGATVVAVGTATFADPRAAERIVEGLERYLAKEGLQSLAEIRLPAAQ